jgi:ribosomal protein S27AE
LQNLAVYEGAKMGEVSASGKVCPRCGARGVEVVHTKRSRIYERPKCAYAGIGTREFTTTWFTTTSRGW